VSLYFSTPFSTVSMVENTPPEVVDLAISCFVNVAQGITTARHSKVDHLCPLTPALSRKGRGSIGIFIRCSNAPGAVPLRLEGLYELRKLGRAHIEDHLIFFSLDITPHNP